jgi:hypothetical protein
MFRSGGANHPTLLPRREGTEVGEVIHAEAAGDFARTISLYGEMRSSDRALRRVRRGFLRDAIG